MTAEAANIFIMRDGEGNYYALSQETLDEHKVTPEQWEQAQKSTGTDDVAGYWFNPAWNPNLYVVGYWPNIYEWEAADPRWAWFGGREYYYNTYPAWPWVP